MRRLQDGLYSEELFTSGAIIELGRWTHARRKFYDAKGSDAQRSAMAMAYIRQLYTIEEEARALITAQKLRWPGT